MSEHHIQVAFVEWLNWQANQYRELSAAYSIPNGGKRSIGVATKLKREGQKSGIPDICIPVARQGFHGLYLEFKNGTKGSVSDNQHAMIFQLQDNGYRVDVVRSVDQAIAVVEDYMGMVNQRGVA